MEEVGKEEVAVARGRIEVPDAAKIDGDAVRLSAQNPDGLVRADPAERRRLTALDDAESRAPLEPCDEVGSLNTELIEPGVVDVAPIEGEDAVRLRDQVSGLTDVMGRAGGYPQERRDVAVVVEQGVELDGALGPSKLRPREDAEAQIDHTGVEGVELVAETKPMLRGLDRALLVESDEQRLVDLVGTSLIGVGERGATNLRRAQAG